MFMQPVVSAMGSACIAYEARHEAGKITWLVCLSTVLCHKGTHRKVNEGAESTLVSVPELSLICHDDHVIRSITGGYESSRGARLAL